MHSKIVIYGVFACANRCQRSALHKLVKQAISLIVLHSSIQNEIFLSDNLRWLGECSG